MIIVVTETNVKLMVEPIMTRGVKQENVWGRPPWRPRDRKACSSITTEQECDRKRPRCWWQPYLQECFTSYIHGSMTFGDRLWERRDSVRRGSHAVFPTVFVLTVFLLICLSEAVEMPGRCGTSERRLEVLRLP